MRGVEMGDQQKAKMCGARGAGCGNPEHRPPEEAGRPHHWGGKAGSARDGGSKAASDDAPVGARQTFSKVRSPERTTKRPKESEGPRAAAIDASSFSVRVKSRIQYRACRIWLSLTTVIYWTSAERVRSLRRRLICE
jgi:hypothetical protein